MVLFQIPGDVPRGSAGQHQQGIENQQTNAGNGQRHHNGDGSGEKRLGKSHGNAPGGRQLGVNGGEGQAVAVENPENDYRQQHQRQHSDLPRRDGENVADEIFIVPGKAAAAHGGNENAQRNGGAGKHANQGIRRLIGAASDKGKQQGKHHAEANRRPDGGGHAADNADGDARKGGVSQSVGEKAHAPGDDHGGENAEQRRHEQQRQQGVFHKVPVEHFKGKCVPDRVPDTHARPPLMWKVRWNSSESSTVCGSP